MGWIIVGIILSIVLLFCYFGIKASVKELREDLTSKLGEALILKNLEEADRLSKEIDKLD